MRAWRTVYKKELTLGLLSLVVSVLFAGGALWFTQIKGLDMVRLTGDARGYQILATHLLEQSAFTFSTTTPFAPESFRAPGYPFFLSILYALCRSWIAVLFVQTILVSIAPVLLYVLFKSYSERAAWWGAVIFVFEPTRLFFSASLLSDAFFTSLFLGSLVLLERGRMHKKSLLIVSSGVVLGVSVLVRPIAVFLPALYAGYVLIAPGMSAGVRFKKAVLLLCATAVIVFPWMLRNHEFFGSWGVSSVGAANLMIYNAPAYLADYPDMKGEAVLAAFKAEQDSLPRDEALSLSRVPVFTSNFREVIRGHEYTYLFFHVAKTVPFFLTDGLREIARISGVPLVAPPNISSLILSGNMKAIVTYIRTGALAVVLLVIGSGFWFMVTVLYFVGIVVELWTRRLRPLVLLGAVLVLYFALLTGPVSNARYRLPISGVMILGAAALVLNTKRNVPPASTLNTI